MQMKLGCDRTAQTRSIRFGDSGSIGSMCSRGRKTVTDNDFVSILSIILFGAI